MKKLTIKSGDKITVEINRQAQPDKQKFAGHLSPKGLIQMRREDDYSPRRKKKGGFINFYDLGYYARDDYYEYFSQVSEAVFTPNEDAQPNIDFVPGDIEAKFAEIETAIFATPTSEFPAKFFKIYKGNPDFERVVKAAYSGTAENTLDNLPEWKAEGLQLDDSQLSTLVVKPLEYLYSADVLNLGAMENLKATLTRDYNADAVEFTPAKSMDVFLMPTMVVSQQFANYRNGLVDTGVFVDYVEQHDYLNYNAQLFPREIVLGQLLDLLDGFDSLDYYRQSYQLGEIMKLLDHARAFRYTRTPSGGSYVTGFAAADAAEVPFAEIYQPDAPLDSGDKFSLSLVRGFYSAAFAAEFARLKAVIKKDGTFYYIWKTD